MMSLSRLTFSPAAAAAAAAARVGSCLTCCGVTPVGSVRYRHAYSGPMAKAIGAPLVKLRTGRIEEWYDHVPEGMQYSDPLTIRFFERMSQTYMLDFKEMFLPKAMRFEDIPDAHLKQAREIADPLLDDEEVVQSVNETTIFDADFFHQKLCHIRRSTQMFYNLHRLLVSNPNLPMYAYKDINLTQNVSFSFSWTRHGRNIQAKDRVPFLLSSRHGLPPIMDAAEVTALSDTFAFRDIDPISPFYGLNRDHPSNNLYGLNQKSLLQYPHTAVFLQHEEEPCMNDVAFKMIVYQFAILSSFALERLGCKMGCDLPFPLTMQALYFNGKSFWSSSFQLNTLDLDGDSGVKNMFWVDKEQVMYDDFAVDFQKHYPITEVNRKAILKYYSFLLNYSFTDLNQDRLVSYDALVTRQ